MPPESTQPASYDVIVVGAGPGAGPRVVVFDGIDSNSLYSFYAFEPLYAGGPRYAGGVSVAAGDVNGEGYADIVVGSLTTFSHVKVFSGRDGSELASFYAFAGFDGGVNVAVADVDHDGRADIIVGTQSGSSHVKVFSGLDGTLLRSFFVFSAGYTAGVSVAAADLDGDGFADVAVGSLRGSSHVKIIGGLDASELTSFYAFDPIFSGISVAVFDADGDGAADFGVGSRAGSRFKAFRFIGLVEFELFHPFEEGDTGSIVLA